jgi:hypothetical protein
MDTTKAAPPGGVAAAKSSISQQIKNAPVQFARIG